MTEEDTNNTKSKSYGKFLDTLQKLTGEPEKRSQKGMRGGIPGRPPKPVEELVRPQRRTINGKVIFVGERYTKYGLVKRKYRKHKQAGPKHFEHRRKVGREACRKNRAKSRARDYRYYKTVEYGFYRYRRKIHHRYGKDSPFTLTMEEYKKIWDEADDVFHDMKLKRPWDVKCKTPLKPDGCYISRVNNQEPWSYENMRIFFMGSLVPRRPTGETKE